MGIMLGVKNRIEKKRRSHDMSGKQSVGVAAVGASQHTARTHTAQHSTECVVWPAAQKPAGRYAPITSWSADGETVAT